MKKNIYKKFCTHILKKDILEFFAQVLVKANMLNLDCERAIRWKEMITK